jgi:hypothetical protein
VHGKSSPSGSLVWPVLQQSSINSSGLGGVIAHSKTSFFSIRCLPFRGMIRGSLWGVSGAGEGKKRAASLQDANPCDPSQGQQGNVAHLADVSVALRHSPDSNGPVRGMNHVQRLRLWPLVGGVWAIDGLKVADLGASVGFRHATRSSQR